MNKNSIETIQTNTTLRVFIAKIIYDKVDFQMCYKKFEQRFDGVSAQERSACSAYYKFCNIIDTVLARM